MGAAPWLPFCFKQGKRQYPVSSDRKYHRLALEPHHGARREVHHKWAAFAQELARVGEICRYAGEHLALFRAKVHGQFKKFVAPLYFFGALNFADADLYLFKVVYANFHKSDCRDYVVGCSSRLISTCSM